MLSLRYMKLQISVDDFLYFGCIHDVTCNHSTIKTISKAGSLKRDLPCSPEGKLHKSVFPFKSFMLPEGLKTREIIYIYIYLVDITHVSLSSFNISLVVLHLETRDRIFLESKVCVAIYSQ